MQEETIVPFVFLTAMVLPEERFSNIQVTNGNQTTFSDQQMVFGYAIPGLTDTLAIDDAKKQLSSGALRHTLRMLRAVRKADSGYTALGTYDGTEGSVRFIVETEEIAP